MLGTVLRIGAMSALAFGGLPPAQFDVALGFSTELLVRAARQKAIGASLSMADTTGIGTKTLGFSSSGVTLRADKIPGGLDQRGFSWGATTMALQAFSSPVAWVFTSKVIEENKEVTRSRDSRVWK